MATVLQSRCFCGLVPTPPHVPPIVGTFHTWRRSMWRQHKDVLAWSKLHLGTAETRALSTTTASCTALHHAAQHKHGGEVVDVLLDAGVDVNAKTADGSTPLLYCALMRHDEALVALMKRGGNVNEKTNNGMSVLHWACMCCTSTRCGQSSWPPGEMGGVRSRPRQPCLVKHPPTTLNWPLHCLPAPLQRPKTRSEKRFNAH
ncbi:unnamed protein product [Ectocarpus sp. 4 AP-2014]